MDYLPYYHNAQIPRLIHISLWNSLILSAVKTLKAPIIPPVLYRKQTPSGYSFRTASRLVNLYAVFSVLGIDNPCILSLAIDVVYLGIAGTVGYSREEDMFEVDRQNLTETFSASTLESVCRMVRGGPSISIRVCPINQLTNEGLRDIANNLSERKIGEALMGGLCCTCLPSCLELLCNGSS